MSRSAEHALGFLPSVADWFTDTFSAPSPAQLDAWPAIRRGDNVLLLAPTGSGKTLAAFLCAIDSLFRKAADGDLTDAVHVLYVSPLKALGNDIQRNLLGPLAAIRAGAAGKLPELRVEVRTGDTPQSDRARMTRTPPHILITTPESLYLMLGSKMATHLESVTTVIVDEVHALCDNKRGVHLALSLERLHARARRPPQRIGCSATLRPLDKIAVFLVGFADDGAQRPCTVVNSGMRKDLDVGSSTPLPDFLEASNSALWASACELLVSEIEKHDTTLIFCNSRHKAERTGLRLRELAGDRVRVGVHHGSMSRETRFEAEDDLKSGRLDALVATSSLELGIDIGSVDLVYQLESAKSVATGLQRIGRAGHLLGATSKGRLLVFDRDELLEAAVVCRGMLDGTIDPVRIPRGCLDVLAQQVAGIVAASETDADALFTLVRRSYSFAELARHDFDSVLRMLAGDIDTGLPRPPRSLLHWDRVTGKLSAARGAAHTCAMCVGTIAETSEYDVVIEDGNRRVGKVQSEFVDDSLRIGDVFVLGSTAWKVTGVRRNRLFVQQAPGSTPTVPWWTGPIEPRTAEVGQAVGELRRQVAERLDDEGLPAWLHQRYRMSAPAAEALVEYVREQRFAAGVVPDHERLLVETWRDELGRSNIIIHSPFGERINRAWGTALAAAAAEQLGQRWSVTPTNDLVFLALQRELPEPLTEGQTKELLALVAADSVADLARGTADTAVSFGGAFRDVAVCSLQVLRAWQGKHVPFWLQSYRAGELCEGIGRNGDHPIVKEVVRGYLEESMDVPGCRHLLQRIETGNAELVFRSVEAPSPFAQSLLVRDLYQHDHQMGRQRRAHLLRLHREVLKQVLSEEQMAGMLDPRAVERVQRRARHHSETTRARTADELATIIHDLGELPADMDEMLATVDGDAETLLADLIDSGRVVAFEALECEGEPARLVPTDLWREHVDAYRPPGRSAMRFALLVPRLEDRELRFDRHPAADLIPARWRRPVPQGEARERVLDRLLRSRGPVSLYEVVNHTGWPAGAVQDILDRLVSRDSAARGVYVSDKPTPQWVNRANLEEIHRLTMGYLKRELAACAPYEVVDFMTRWQHRHPDTRVSGLDGLRTVIGQLQGFEVMQGALEPEVLAGRIEDYKPQMLERLIASGEVVWRRVGDGVSRGKLTLCFRNDAKWLARGRDWTFDVAKGADADIRGEIGTVRHYFRENSPAFFHAMLDATGVEQGTGMRAVWYLAWCGELTCDTYECVRHADFQATLSGCYDLYSIPERILTGKASAAAVVERMRRRKLNPRLGRWEATERLRTYAGGTAERRLDLWVDQLLRRWGILTKRILDTECCSPSWGELIPELKRRELLGQIQRGYFVHGHFGEQYGLPDAIELLRDCRARRSEGRELGYLSDEAVFCVTNRDPANLYARSFDVVEERGTPLKIPVRSGNVVHRLVLQAGQVLLYHRQDVRLLATLTRPQLSRCIEALTHDPSGAETQVIVTEWNGYPIDTSPATGVLAECGFAFDRKDRMRYPPPIRPVEATTDAQSVDRFLPYYEQPPPVNYGPEWFIARCPDGSRPLVKAVLDCVLPKTDERTWDLSWGSNPAVLRYRGHKCIELLVRKSRLYVMVQSATMRRDDGKRWGLYRRRAVTDMGEVESGLREWLIETVARACDVTDQAVAQQDGFSEGRRAAASATSAEHSEQHPASPEDVIVINRAPVLTLWGAIVAKRMGYEPDTALTLGRCLAGLNAQTKGRRLGIFETPTTAEGGSPAKVGLGEEFWIELCGRPLPAKSTADGIRAVTLDKPISPTTVERYLKGKFGDHLTRVRDAMKALADSIPLPDVQQQSWQLYKRFRPDVPEDITGWGAQAVLNLALIRSLAQRQPL